MLRILVSSEQLMKTLTFNIAQNVTTMKASAKKNKQKNKDTSHIKKKFCHAVAILRGNNLVFLIIIENKRQVLIKQEFIILQ